VPKKPISDQVVLVTGPPAGSAAQWRDWRESVARRWSSPPATPRRWTPASARSSRAGSQALAVPGDVADQAHVERAVEAAVERFGRIDTYVANAVVTVYAEAYRLEPEELRRVWEVNFFGVVYGYWAALPHLRSSRGTFLHVSSALAYRGIPLQAAYCSTKAGLRAFLESARVEEQKAGTGVDISLVLPGAINTPQFDRDRQKIGYQPQPVPPIYQPEPYAEAVLHCMERPIRELPVSWGAQKAAVGPEARAARRRLGSAAGTAGRASTPTRPKPLDAPDNLFDTLPGTQEPTVGSTTSRAAPRLDEAEAAHPEGLRAGR
jgi:NAD(P)-dependent dehydrogenase (short-subunit alcohol dehydrogenase family)